MKVTLVFPCIRNSGGWNSLGKHQENCYINHGLPSIAASLEHSGHEVKLLDLREMSGWKEVEEWIQHDDSNVYGINMPTLDYHEAKQVATIIKRVSPECNIYVGGPHPSIVPDVVAKDEVFDYIVVGEGEITFPDMIENPSKYPRITIAVHPDLDKLPYEKREIFNIEKVLHTHHSIYPQPFLTVISGRGCLYNCSFCKPGEDLIFGKFRMRNIDHFFGEIEMLNNKYKFAMLMIDDDSFTLKPDYIMEFCDRYEKIGKPFVCQSRADFICRNADILKRMKEVGLWMLSIGFEVGNQRMLTLLRKGTTVEQNYEAARICHKMGIKMWANIMFGSPTETKQEMLATLKMIKAIKPFILSPAFFTPIVGTDLYDYCDKNNLIADKDPAVLGRRAQQIEKPLKGVDYDWINRQLYGRTGLLRKKARTWLGKTFPWIKDMRSKCHGLRRK